MLALGPITQYVKIVLYLSQMEFEQPSLLSHHGAGQYYGTIRNNHFIIKVGYYYNACPLGTDVMHGILLTIILLQGLPIAPPPISKLIWKDT